MISTESALTPRVAASASAHGIQVLASEPAVSLSGAPTTRFTLALAKHPEKTLLLELTEAYDLANETYIEYLDTFFKDTARRLLNPIPTALLTLGGIPLRYSHFEWPFHESTAGADTSVVHGQVDLDAPNPDGSGKPLFAKVAAAMTITFRDIVKSPEQPFAESFILNAIRKTLDMGQLELVKSGNRQPVQVTTRYFSLWQKRFIFNDTTEPERRNFLAAKAYWFSAVHGGNAPIWLADPQDAQYLNATPADLKASIATLVHDGFLSQAADPEFATPTPALAARAPEFHAHLAEALAFIKPSFNEDMRQGHTNM
jgi:hypothetical protein